MFREQEIGIVCGVWGDNFFVSTLIVKPITAYIVIEQMNGINKNP